MSTTKPRLTYTERVLWTPATERRPHVMPLDPAARALVVVPAARTAGPG